MKKLIALCVAAAATGIGTADAATYVDLFIANARDHAFDGNLLYVTSGAQLHRYDLSSCTLYPPLTLGQQLIGIEASPDGRYVAVANDGIVNGNVRVFLFDKFGQRAPRIVSYPAAFGENGSYMVSWEGNSSLLISGTYGGSGWTPLRRYDVATGALMQVRSVRQSTMLAAAANGQTTALAESNISSGPVHVLDAGGGNGASANTNWFLFEVAANSDGSRLIVPTYGGAFLYQRQDTALSQTGTIGAYADHGPVAAAFSPDDDRIVTASYAWTANPTRQGILLYDAQTLARISTIDPYPFGWTGNGALGAGRLTLSRDGNWLAATLNDRVRLYDVHNELGDADRTPSGCTAAVPTFDDYAEERTLQQQVERAAPRAVDAQGRFLDPTAKPHP
jgi:WD40 repeat protein